MLRSHYHQAINHLASAFLEQGDSFLTLISQPSIFSTIEGHYESDEDDIRSRVLVQETLHEPARRRVKSIPRVQGWGSLRNEASRSVVGDSRK